jgi:hypothetical protein
MNDGLFIINEAPSPSGTDSPPDTPHPGLVVIASVTEFQREYETTASNARLLAAAPELLAALKAMICVMDRGPSPKKLDDALSWRECDEKARSMAEAAIVKAEASNAR